MGREAAYTGFWCGNLRERDYLGDPSIDERIILRWIFREWVVGILTGSKCLSFLFDGKLRLYEKSMAVLPL
jgi:hypothetical protein